MHLSDLMKSIDYRLLLGDVNIEISGLHYDSRQVKPGMVFVCIGGLKTDGHFYINNAIENGAAAIIVEKEISVPENISCIKVDNTRGILPVLAANFYGEPSRDLRVVGVTGTNGKTTTTHLIKTILEKAGKKTAIMGTLYAKIDELEKNFKHTTPEAVEIEEFFALSRDKGAEYLVMEVSSHALDLKRVDRIHFNTGIFTNLSQDHLDYHHDMESYKKAKLKLFEMIPHNPGNFSIINGDDSHALDFIQAAGKNSCTYAIRTEAAVTAHNIQLSLKGSSFAVKYDGGEFKVNIELMGLFNVYNALAAIAFGLKEGLPPDIIKSALQEVTGVPGRFEQVPSLHGFTVAVDYAHTPDGLDNILQAARQLTTGRIITVFGCGGDRDRGKRPVMGEIAARYSDFCVVTTDNPRSEEPEAIIADIIPGLNRVEESRYAVIMDRREAIRHAIYLAREGDLVVIAGKGHETYQLIKGEVFEFDDRKVAAQFLQEKPL